MSEVLTRGKVRAGLEAVILRTLSGLPDGEPIAEHELEALDQAIAREMDANFVVFDQGRGPRIRPLG